MLLNNNIDWIKLKNVYNRTIKDDYAEYNIKKIIRQRESQQVITEELVKIYELNGVTPDYVVKQELELLDKAKSKDDLSNAIKIVSNFRESLDLKPKQQQTTREETNYLSFIDKKQGKIEAKQVIKQIDSQPSDNKPSEAND